MERHKISIGVVGCSISVIPRIIISTTVSLIHCPYLTQEAGY